MNAISRCAAFERNSLVTNSLYRLNRLSIVPENNYMNKKFHIFCQYVTLSIDILKLYTRRISEMLSHSGKAGIFFHTCNLIELSWQSEFIFSVQFPEENICVLYCHECTCKITHVTLPLLQDCRQGRDQQLGFQQEKESFLVTPGTSVQLFLQTITTRKANFTPDPKQSCIEGYKKKKI